MRRTSHRIFWDADARSKTARDKIAIPPRRGRDHGLSLYLREAREIRSQGRHFFFAAKDREKIALAPDLERGRAQSVDQFVRRTCLPRRPRRKIEHEPLAFSLDLQLAAARLETHHIAGVIPMPKNHVRGRKRGVTAQFHFDRRRHPAKIEMLCALDQERSFRKVVLRGDRLHLRIGQPVLEQTNTRRIAGEKTVGESRDFEKRNCHFQLSPRLRSDANRGAILLDPAPAIGQISRE